MAPRPKKMKTGIFTTGGKPVGGTAQGIADAMNGSTGATDLPVKADIRFPQPGEYDIYGMTSAKVPVTVGNTGQYSGITDDNNSLIQAYLNKLSLGSGTGKAINPAIQQATAASMAGLAGGAYAAPYQPTLDYLAGLQSQQQTAYDTGAYKAPTQALSKELGRQYGQAGENITTSNQAFLDYLAGQTNPFEGVTAQTTTVDPQFLETLKQQGVSTVPVTTQFEAQQQAAKASGEQFGNLINILKGLEDQGLVSAKTAAGLQKDFATQNLETNRALYGSQIAAQEEAARKAAEDAIKETIAGQAKTMSDIAGARSGAQTDLLKLLTSGGKLSQKQINQAFGEPLAAGAPKTFRAAVSSEHPNFKGTTAEAKKKFPKLAAKYGK